MPPLLEAIHLFPVKSCAGLLVSEAAVTPRGLRHDRRWMIVDAQGEFRTQREFPQLARVTPALAGKELRLNIPEQGEFALPLEPQEGEAQSVVVWEDTVRALAPALSGNHRNLDRELEVDEALSRFLGSPSRLVYQPDSSVREVDPDYGRPGDHVSWADGFPLLLATSASLEELNRRLETPVAMNRFRPNLVISGTSPHAEDHWSRFRIGAVRFRAVKPCARCVMTTVDPERGSSSGKEPLKTLATYRTFGNRVLFGQNVIPDLPSPAEDAVLQVGSVLEVVP